MSFLYPRVVSITRPGAQPAAVGDQGEAPGYVSALETTVATDLPASIQARQASGKPGVGLPADGATNTWRILFPLSATPVPGLIKNRDIVTDELGNRFQVVAPYWNSLGCNLIAQSLDP